MAFRGYGIQTLTGTAAPVFGTTLTAPIFYITPDARHRAINNPGAQGSTATAQVANANFFRVGDTVNIGNATGPFDSAKITSITYGAAPAATIGLQGLTTTHTTGQYVILAIPAAIIRIQAVAIAGTDQIYIGEDNTVGPTSATLMAVLTAAGQTFPAAGSPTVAAFDTPHFWINGTAGDTYVISIYNL